MPTRALETSARIAGEEGVLTVRVDGLTVYIESRTRSVSLSLGDFGLVVAEVAAYGRAVEAADRRDGGNEPPAWDGG